MDIELLELAKQNLQSIKDEIEGKSYEEVKRKYCTLPTEEDFFYCGYFHLGLYVYNNNGFACIKSDIDIEVWDDLGNQVGVISY